jgi:hypothetical protein
MLDLKSKLLAAGLVSQEQIDKVERQKADKKKKKTAQRVESKERNRHLEELLKLQKTDQYDLIRKWVTRNRLDKPTSVEPEAFDKFFFEATDGSVSWLTIEKSLHEKIANGSAGITAYMSHHGMVHCVLSREIIEDIAQAFPTWVRVLKEPVQA